MTNETENPSPPQPTVRNKEPIPGYQLVERIGVGGYGEVWKAEAPGGLTKAVKLVYGHMDDTRAARELKALNRIKEVRHPFLLSLERIEVVDGQLVVVTELAQTNLKEVFVECQRAGMVGIPRERLLEYLKDAADALDYIRDNYNLQHLDVKPENLLLVGDRVKVADFGLVRELFNSNASLMGGLTPNYAPPEVFDGRPDQHSDQYSLAIVYQEMLTGVLPFAGRTAAQLAAQHMHSQPKLESLPPADRVAVARALSKDPGKRFASCLAFVQTLMKPEMAAAAVVQRGSAPAKFTGPSKTISLDEIEGGSQTLEKAPRCHEDVEMAELDPLDLSGKHLCRPTLFLSIGGAAVETLRLLRRRLHDRLGDLDDVPAIQMLAIDSDRSSLAQACSETDAAALKTRETLALPLRRTQDYRADSDKFLSWMSRRWIYNIPRSQQTEGLRPLGRLVMVDHAEQLMERIRDVIGVLSDEDAIHESTKASGTKFEVTAPRVFIVASIAGGTGSGMVLDVGYAVRQILAEHGHPDDGVCGILTHHTDRRASAQDLAVGNTLACLAELKHYSQPAGHYPGDAIMGLASFNGRTFHHGYLVHLGDELGPEELGERLDRVAEYLFCNSVSRAGAFFDQSRRQEHQQHPVQCPETSLRSFGLCQLGLSNSELPTDMADAICSRLLEDWRGGPQTSNSSKPVKFSDVTAGSKTEADKVSAFDSTVDRLAKDRAASLKLDIDQIAKETMDLAQEEMGSDPDAYFTELIKQFKSQQAATSGTAAMKGLMDLTDRMLGTDTNDGRAEADFLPLQAVINDRLKEVADQRGSMLRDWVWELVDNSRGRIRGARRATKWLAEHLQSLARQAGDKAKSHADDALSLRRQLLDPAQQDEQQELANQPLVSRYYRLRLNQTLMRGVAKTLRRIDEIHVAAASEQLQGLLRELDALAGKFKANSLMEPPRPDGNGALTFHQYVRWSSQSALSHRAAEFAAEVEATLFGSDGGLRVLLASNAGVQTDLADTLRTTARQVLRQAVREVNVAEVVLAATASSQDQDSNPLRKCVAMAHPFWTKCGGARRLLTVVPESSAREPIAASLEHYLEQSMNLVFDADGDLVFCYEAEGLEIIDLAWSLIGDRPDLLQVAARLHTRTDVDWLSLI